MRRHINLKLKMLIHHNPSYSFSIVLLNIMMICFVFYLCSAELLNKYANESNNQLYFKIFNLESLAFLLFFIFSLYVKLRRAKVYKKRIFLSDLAYGLHETTILDRSIIETVSLHLDRKIGLKHLATLDKSKGLVTGRYVANQTIDSILFMHSEIKTNINYKTVEYIVGESHHVKHFKRKLTKIGIKVKPMLFSSNLLSTFILMWLYNIRYQKKIMPNFKDIGLSYRFQIPIEWLNDPLNLKKITDMKR
jgi:hypothetical protein